MARFDMLAGFVLCAGLFAASSAAAAPGVELFQPRLDQRPEGVRVQGAVCRAVPALTAGGVELKVQKLDSTGAVVAETKARRDLRPRDRACAFYSVQTAWTVAPTESVRVCATTHGRLACV